MDTLISLEEEKRRCTVKTAAHHGLFGHARLAVSAGQLYQGRFGPCDRDTSEPEQASNGT